MGIMQRLVDADSNAEGRDLFERGPIRVSWGWLWTQWTFGIGLEVAPLNAWVSVGPLSLGFAYERTGAS